MDAPEMADDPKWSTHAARGEHEHQLDGIVADWTKRFDSDALLELLRQHSVPAGRVYTAADMLTDEHYLAREMVQRLTSRAGIDTAMLGVVPKFSRTPGSIRDVGPTLGEHTEQYR
jgi:formyl-CoA transferase